MRMKVTREYSFTGYLFKFIDDRLLSFIKENQQKDG